MLKYGSAGCTATRLKVNTHMIQPISENKLVRSLRGLPQTILASFLKWAVSCACALLNGLQYIQ